MKIVEKHIGTFFLTIAFLLAFGNTSFAFPNQYEKASPINFTQTDTHSKPILFQATSIGEVSSLVSLTEHKGFGLWSFVHTPYNSSEIKISSLSASFYNQEDKRKLICQQIFPFHFFW